jgi:hypothetical protein
MAAAALLLAAIAISVAWLNSRHGPLPQRVALEETRDTARKRPVYPYSVVPGGVYSADELKAAVAQDAVVAAHYSGFGTSRVRRISLESDRPAYVSFRIDDAVFWTKRPVSLRRGEQVLSDGESLVRTRCGNRTSDVPRTPVSPHEPMEGVMDEADPALVEPLAQALLESLPLAKDPIFLELQASVISGELDLGLPPLPGGSTADFDPWAPPPPLGAPVPLLIVLNLLPDQPDDPIEPPVTPDPPPVPVLIPEPSSVLLVVTSVLIIGVAFKRHWRRSK